MSFKQKSQLRSILITTSIVGAYYLLLVVYIGEHELLFKGLEIQEFSINWTILFRLSNYWWFFSTFAIVGEIAKHSSKPMVVKPFFLISTILLFLIFIFTFYTVLFTPIFTSLVVVN